jgi:hypothetical protein
MELITFIKGLTHKFSKNELAKSCELTLASLREHTLPAYASATSTFKVFRFSSSEGKNMAADFKRMAGGNDMLGTIEEALLNSQSLLTEIDKKSDTLFADAEASMALTYQKATYIQIVSAINFANDYARKLLNYLYIVETAKADHEVSLPGSLSKAEIEYVEQYFTAFCTCIKCMLMDFKAIDKAVSGMPDAVVTELTEQTLPQTLGMGALDPMGLRGLSLPIKVSVKWNPFYLLGTMIAAYQVASYKTSKEELDLLQMRKMNLEKVLAGKPDARLQKEIEYLSERVSALNYELQKAQEKYGVQ